MRWQASKAYAVGEYCFTEYSSWLPVYCFECITAGTSNGWRPTHKSGTVIEGEEVYPKNLDACYWQYVGPLSNFANANFSPNMNVRTGQVIYADHKLYKVTAAGALRPIPPVSTPWKESFTEGTAGLMFIGKDWEAHTWWAQDCYCVSLVDGVKTVYKLVNQDGTTSGSVPVPGNAHCVDGDMIWEYTTAAATKQWAGQAQFFEGDIVSANGNSYRCVFDGRLRVRLLGTGDGYPYESWQQGKMDDKDFQCGVLPFSVVQFLFLPCREPGSANSAGWECRWRYFWWFFFRYRCECYP